MSGEWWESSAQSPAGWYPDPNVPSRERYWDGASWTDQIRDASEPPTRTAESGPPATPVLADSTEAGANGETYVGPDSEPDRYRLLGRVGLGGGEGEIWKATISVDGVDLAVAAKIIHPNLSADLAAWRERWQRQVDLLQSIDHPGIVKVRQVFEGPLPHPRGGADPSSRTLYLIMNWVEGETIASYVETHPNRDLLDCARILTALSGAVDYLHRSAVTGTPVLHRDIKPANIIVNGSQVTLVDFGITRLATNQNLTIAGTPAYLAPEAVAGQHTEASDRYAVGGTAFYLLVGHHPSPRSGSDATRSALVAAPLTAGKPAIVDRVMAMIDPDPSRRPSDLVSWAQGFAYEAVTNPGASAGVPPPPPPTVPTPQTDPNPTSGRKSRRKLWLGLAAVIALLIAGGVAAVVVTRPDAERAEAGRAASAVTVAPPRSTTTSTSSSSSSTTTTRPDSLADFAGQTIDAARSTLQGLGIEVVMNDVVDTRPDGTVISQDPPAGAALPTRVTLNVARPGDRVYLADLSPVEGATPDLERTNLNGTPFYHPLSSEVCTYEYDNSGTERIGYDLSRNFKRLTGMAGPSDSAQTGASFHFEILGDNRVLWQADAGLGQSPGFDVDVSNVLRLLLRVTFTGDRQAISCAHYVWADPVMVGLPGSAPATTGPGGFGK